VSQRDRLVLQPIAGAPQVGLLLAALEDGRRRTLLELTSVDEEMLGRRPTALPLHTISQLLYHVALIEADWVLTEIQELPESEWPSWVEAAFPIDVRDGGGRLSDIPPEPMRSALERLARVRSHALDAIGALDEAELHRIRSLPPYDVSPAWAIHHLVQHEAEHRAQIAMTRDLLLAEA
jgi:uncharacterized damage-inducible protein DinB